MGLRVPLAGQDGRRAPCLTPPAAAPQSPGICLGTPPSLAAPRHVIQRPHPKLGLALACPSPTFQEQFS